MSIVGGVFFGSYSLFFLEFLARLQRAPKQILELERHRISTFTSTTFTCIYITEDKYEIEIISSYKTLSFYSVAMIEKK